MSAIVIRSIPSIATAREIHPRPERDRRQQRQLVARVDPAHVEARIGLQVAELLALLEHLVVAQARALHPRQDVVAGAVHHAHDALHLVARQPLGQRLDHRDAARHRRLEAQRRARRLGPLGQRLPVQRHHRLVGGHHVLAGVERGLDRGLGRPVRAAHQLDEHVHVVAPRQRHRVVLPGVAAERHAPILVAGARRDRAHGDLAPGPRRQQRPAPPHDLHDARTDGAEPRNAEPERM